MSATTALAEPLSHHGQFSANPPFSTQPKMAATLQFQFPSSIRYFHPLFPLRSSTFLPRFGPVSVSFTSISAPILRCDTFILRFGRKIRRKQYSVAAVMLLPENPVVSDICATALSGCVALSLLRLWAETAKRGLDQVLLLFVHWFSVRPCVFPRSLLLSFIGQLLGFCQNRIGYAIKNQDSQERILNLEFCV